VSFQLLGDPVFKSLQLLFGIVAGGVRRVYAQDCNILAFGDRDTYGRVVEWDEIFGEGGNAVSGFELDQPLGEAMSVSDGLPVLEAQTKLVRILLKTHL
jgi:hypothetical protein